MRRTIRTVSALGVLLATFIYWNNAAWLADAPAGKPVLLAHRGLAQTFDLDGVTGDTCTATRIHAPEHHYLENTLASMEAAFRAGADIVEFDIHPTTDGRFAVFHDWTLDCRTDGTGVTREHTLSQLKALDVGYGYTADAGKTFPFRGKGVGLMPSLDEVLAAFPAKRFLIHIKSNDPHEGEELAARLGELPQARRARLIVYGGDLPVAVVRQRLPDMRTMSRASLMQCLLRYNRDRLDGIRPNLVPPQHGAGAHQCRALALGLAQWRARSYGARRQPCRCGWPLPSWRVFAWYRQRG